MRLVVLRARCSRDWLDEAAQPDATAGTQIEMSACAAFTHVSEINKNMYFPNSLGTDVAWIDWDNDRDTGILLAANTLWLEDENQATDVPWRFPRY